jgi:hypothetical protein
MNNINYRHPVIIPYEVQEFISAEVHRVCSPQRAIKLVPVCFEALEHYVLGDLLAEVALPEGCSNDGSLVAPVWLLVEELGLDLFVNEIRLANQMPLFGTTPLAEIADQLSDL